MASRILTRAELDEIVAITRAAGITRSEVVRMLKGTVSVKAFDTSAKRQGLARQRSPRNRTQPETEQG